MDLANIKRIRTEYKYSLKFSAGEEFFDLAVHRPIAYIVVKLIQPLPITPNQVTGFSVLVYLAATYCLATNSPVNVAIAGILILLGNVLDAVDGQLARLRGTASHYGRIIDGVGDYISFISIYIGIALWHPPEEISSLLWIVLAALTLFGLGWQSSLVDYYRNEFSFRLSGKINFGREDLRQTMEDLAKVELVKGSSFQRFVLSSYASYLSTQQKLQGGNDALEHVPPARYVKANSKLIRFWCMNGSATPRFLMAVFCLFNRLDFIVVYILIIGMAWTLTLLAVQKATDRRLRRENS